MAWILAGALLVSGTFFLMVLRQILRTEERLRGIVVRNEARIAQRYKARLLVPRDGEAEEEG